MPGDPISRIPHRESSFETPAASASVSADSRRRFALSDIKPASANKYSIAGVRGPKYSWGSSLSLVSPSRSFHPFPSLPSFLVLRSLLSPAASALASLTTAVICSYWTSVDSLCHPDPLGPILRDVPLPRPLDGESRDDC